MQAVGRGPGLGIAHKKVVRFQFEFAMQKDTGLFAPGRFIAVFEDHATVEVVLHDLSPGATIPVG
jgi:hypothetical protein